MRRSCVTLLALVPLLAGCKSNDAAPAPAPASAQPVAVASATTAPSATANPAAAAAASGTPLAKGVAAPDFKLEGSDGKTHALADHVGKQAVVIAWFPKAFTGG